MTETELAFTQAAIGQRDALSYETPGQKAGFLSQISSLDLDEDFVDTQKAILAALTTEATAAVAARELRMQDMIIVVVGDKAAILPQLETLDFDIVELDPKAEAVASARE